MWEQIQANRRRSAVLITGMAVILLVIGFTGGELLARNGGVFGLLLALLLWGGMMLAYFTSAESILMAGASARELKKEDSPQLFNIVDEMRLASGLGFMPRIYLIDDPAPNAFAVGRKPETSSITVTTGLMYRLNRDELQGVIAHEMGHLKNRDVQFMTLAAVMLGSIVILSEIVRRSLWYGGRGRSRSDSRDGKDGDQLQVVILVVGLLFAILGPIMAQLLYFACSRKREYLADASGAQFTRYPEGLASALEKISQAHVPLSFASKATAPMFIVNPLSAAENDGDESDSVFSSHPPTSQRIKILRAMTGASFTDYEAAYRKAKGGSLIGAQSLQSAPTKAIRAPSNEGPIQSRQEGQVQATDQRRQARQGRPHPCHAKADPSSQTLSATPSRAAPSPPARAAAPRRSRASRRSGSPASSRAPSSSPALSPRRRRARSACGAISRAARARDSRSGAPRRARAPGRRATPSGSGG